MEVAFYISEEKLKKLTAEKEKSIAKLKKNIKQEWETRAPIFEMFELAITNVRTTNQQLEQARIGTQLFLPNSKITELNLFSKNFGRVLNLGPS